MRQSSEPHETKGLNYEDPRKLEGKERRRFQNRIAQRNHRRRKRSECLREKLRDHYLEGTDIRFQAQQNMTDRWFHTLSSVPIQKPLSPVSPANPGEVPNSCDDSLACSDYWAAKGRSESDSLLSRPEAQSTKGSGCTPHFLNTWCDSDDSQPDSRRAGANFGLDLKGMELETSRMAIANQPESPNVSIAADHIFRQEDRAPDIIPAQVDLDFHDHVSRGTGDTFDRVRGINPHDNDSTYTITYSLPAIFGTSNPSNNERNLAGKTALHLSAENGHDKVVRCLLDNGSDVGARDILGATALHYAAKMGNVDVMKALLARGGDGNATDQRGQTPLHMAAENGHEAAVQILVQSGVRVDSQIRSQ